MKRRYYSYNQYLREKFGCRVHKLSLDAGFSCPNFDGSLSRTGCIFCNNRAFSPFSREPGLSLEDQIIRSMSFSKKRFKAKKFIAYFQSFSSTYADPAELKKKYDVIRKFKDIVGLAISTRPDCIDKAKLDLIGGYAQDYRVYLEYGLQTMHDRTLQKINRNHSFVDFTRAVEMTAKRKNIHTSAHVIIGLPGEGEKEIKETASAVAGLPLWGIKFHCLHAVKDTVLADMYDRGEVSLLSEDEYIDLLIQFLEIIPEQWVILRLVSDADRDCLIAPQWVNQKQRILQKIEKELETRDTRQGKYSPKS